jgi:nucleotide-binding universal stress UspA family protein
MLAIRIVVSPVDFSPATGRQLNLAIDICRAFGARLVLHHNVTDVSVGAGVGWMWHADKKPPSNPSPDDQLRSLVSHVPRDVPVESCITRGALTEGVMTVSEVAQADLVVLSAHDGETKDHASVIDHLLERSNRSVLVLHDPGTDLTVPRFASGEGQPVLLQSLLVPTNLSGESHEQVTLAWDLARRFPFRVDLLHVMEDHVPGEADRAAVAQLEALVHDDLASRTTVHVRTGDTVPTIVEAARDLGAFCIVMGEHTRAPIKRWLTHDTSRAVLQQASCPIWYAPPIAREPGLSISRFALSDEKSIIWGNV